MTYNNHFVINKKWGDVDDEIEGLDLDLNQIIAVKDKYYKVIMDSDLLVLLSKSKPALVFYKGDKVILDERIVDVDHVVGTDLWTIKGRNGLKGMMNTKMEIVIEMEYEEINHTAFSKFITLSKGRNKTLANENGKFIKTVTCEKLEYLYQDRFAIKNRGKWQVIELNDNVIINYEIDDEMMIPIPFEKYGRKMISTTFSKNGIVHDYNGDLLYEWTSKTKQDKEISSKYLSGLNKKAIKNLSKEIALRINPSNIWIERLDTGGSNYDYRLARQNEEKITSRHSRITRTFNERIFLVKTKNNKYGLVQIKD